MLNRLPHPSPADELGFGVADHRAVVLRAAQERAAQRQSMIAAQSAMAAAPDERIRLWEELHALRLPKSAEHNLLRVIARDTGLTLKQLQDEQRRRSDELVALREQRA